MTMVMTCLVQATNNSFKKYSLDRSGWQLMALCVSSGIDGVIDITGIDAVALFFGEYEAASLIIRLRP
jgi:dihydropteroate synthase